MGGTIGDTQVRRSVGSASVLQVWKTNAQVSLDSGARTAEGEKLAQLEHGTERDLPLSWVNVKCREGEARFAL